jgi:hypothetical protein
MNVLLSRLRVALRKLEEVADWDEVCSAMHHHHQGCLQ